MPPASAMPASAVLLSGGLDSAVLAAMELEHGRVVWPIHVRAGLAWENDEAVVLGRLLAAPPFAGRVQPLTTLGVDMRDLYAGDHWAIVGTAPDYDRPDEDVYLEGRNIVLIAKAAVFCARRGIERLVLGPLAGNPFPDATAGFFDTMGRAMSLGLARPLTIEAPLRTLHKSDVVRVGARLQVPLAMTLSCMQPVETRHCGRCNKCRERREAFAAAGLVDPTSYLAPEPGAGGSR
jgi:7-cyano-7-deazaguanine synthase